MFHKKQSNPPKLPQIQTKTSQSLGNETKLRRPLSSTKVQDLSNKLFSQLDQYEKISKKTNKKGISSKKKIATNSSKEVQLNSIQYENPSLQKLQKLLPEKYSKIFRKDQKNQNNKMEINRTKEQEKVKVQPTNKNNKKTNKQDSFAVAEREVEEIYKQYLREEGIEDIKETSTEDMKKINEDISQTEVELEGLRNSMFDMITKFGHACTMQQD